MYIGYVSDSNLVAVEKVELAILSSVLVRVIMVVVVAGGIVLLVVWTAAAAAAAAAVVVVVVAGSVNLKKNTYCKNSKFNKCKFSVSFAIIK